LLLSYSRQISSLLKRSSPTCIQAPSVLTAGNSSTAKRIASATVLRDEQLSRQVVVERHSRSQYPFEFVFLDNPIKRLVSTLDAISVFTVLRGQVLYDLDVARTSPTEGSGRVVYRLPDLEFVVTHVITEPLLPRHGIMKRFSKSDLYGSRLSPSGVTG